MDDTHNFVVPALDAGIQEFYQVGEHKSYVKIQRLMENWIPVSGHWDDRKRRYLDDKKEVLG